jgi:hypothetical protein
MRLAPALLLVGVLSTQAFAADSVEQRIQAENQRQDAAAHARMERMEILFSKREFREARIQELRKFYRALVLEDFNGFAATLSKESRQDILGLIQGIVGTIPLPENAKGRDIQTLNAIINAKRPEDLPSEYQEVFISNFTRAYVTAIKARERISIKQVDLMDLDFAIPEAILGRIKVKARLGSQEMQKSLQLVEEEDGWKIDLGLHSAIPVLLEQIHKTSKVVPSSR